MAIGIEIVEKGIQDIKNSSPATSSVHYSGNKESDDKEKPVGKDSVSMMNWYWYGERHWAGFCKFRRRNVIVATYCCKDVKIGQQEAKRYKSY